MEGAGVANVASAASGEFCWLMGGKLVGTVGSDLAEAGRAGAAVPSNSVLSPPPAIDGKPPLDARLPGNASSLAIVADGSPLAAANGGNVAC